MRITFDKSDLCKCFEFAVKYHLAEGKSNFNRTTGQYRGLGSIVNDFFYGKLIEVGTAKAIQSFNPKLNVGLDFEIHPLAASDPDIVSVDDGESVRKPKIFVEIKNVSAGDRWVGLTQEQFETIQKNPLVFEDCSNVYLIYARIINLSHDKDDDILGVYLKSEMNSELMNGFCNIEEICMEFQYILRGDELKANGVEFKQGSFFYETEIAGEKIDEDVKNKVLETGYKVIESGTGKFPIIMRNKSKSPAEFGDFHADGNYRLFIKENRMSNRVYLHCLTDVKLTNKVLGVFNFEEGDMHELLFNTIGRDPVLKRNNIWTAQRNLKNIMSESVEDRIFQIAFEL